MVVAGLSGPVARVDTPATGQPLGLTTATTDVGYVSITVGGPPGGTVEVREEVGSRRPVVARIALSAE
jgi:hypothetical protein